MLLLATLAAGAQTVPDHLRWSGTWASSQMETQPGDLKQNDEFRDTTLRQIVHISTGGSYVRIRISNTFGVAPLYLTSVHLAKAVSPSSSAIEASSDQALTFGGRQEVTVPAGSEYLSDPVAFDAAPLSNLAITMHIYGAPGVPTMHQNSNETSYYVHGDHVSAADMTGAMTVDHWFFLSGVEVGAPSQNDCIVAFGDSITDGWRSTLNGNDRWPDVLAQRLQQNSGTKDVCVLNEGMGGNRVIMEGAGPSAVARLDRDAIAQPGAKYIILLEAVNDLGNAAIQENVPQSERDTLVANLLLAYQQIIERAHAHGIKVFGATITPYAGASYYRPEFEAARQQVNTWIRTPGHFDGVVDFDKATRDPAHPDQFLPAYDSGDHLHPNPAGYKAMADSIPLAYFEGK